VAGETILFNVTGPNGYSASIAGTMNASGQAVLDAASLPGWPLAAGAYEITATYGGDGAYQPSSSSAVSQTITNAGTQLTLSSSASPATIGVADTITATIAGLSPATGTPPDNEPITFAVTFNDSSGAVTQQYTTTANISGGMAQISVTPSSPGTFSITASYPGDTNFARSAATLNLTAGQAVSQTVLTTSANPAVYGDPVTFHVAVASANPAISVAPSGTVSFYNAATSALLSTQTLTVNGSTASADYTTNTLAVGTTKVRAVYSGSSIYLASGAQISETVARPGTTAVTMTLSAAPATTVPAGTTVTFTANVASAATPAPTGWVTFLVNGVKKVQYQLSATSGSAASVKAAFTFTTAGSYTVTASYTGDSTYQAASKAITEKVTQPTTTSLTSSTVPSWPANTAVPGAPITFTATVATSGGAVPTGSVSFYNNGVRIATVTLSGGVATFTSSGLALGSHTITAIYNGASTFATSNAALTEQVVAPGSLGSSVRTTTALSASTTTPTTGVPVTFTATVAAASGVPTGFVTFYVNGVAKKKVALDQFGMASFVTSLTGTSSIYAVYSGDPTNDLSSRSNTMTARFPTGGGQGTLS
jgi:hypothetical protein